MDTDKKTQVLREGFLVKRGHVVHSWKARWFVLMPDTCPFLEFENRPLVFKLQSANGVDHYLEACTREERDDWAADISAAADNLQTAGDENMTNKQVLDSMYDIHSGIRMSNHVEQGSTYRNCFSGERLKHPVFIAVTLATALLEEGFLRTVGLKSMEALRTAGLSEQFMDDSTALYGFSDSLKKRGSVKAETSQSALELSGKVVKRGYLLKQGHRRKNWKVRLFVLRSDPAFLHYYNPTKDDISPVGGFSLRGCLVSSLEDNGVPSGVKGNMQGNLFKIITQSDTRYFIQAPTHQEKMGWIDAIKEQT
uniref:PH domain-containing protein n=1 Tax=Monopterus albus TaxID=43700 RepID=A0A3Q3K9I2_MONAL